MYNVQEWNLISTIALLSTQIYLVIVQWQTMLELFVKTLLCLTHPPPLNILFTHHYTHLTLQCRLLIVSIQCRHSTVNTRQCRHSTVNTPQCLHSTVNTPQCPHSTVNSPQCLLSTVNYRQCLYK